MRCSRVLALGALLLGATSVQAGSMVGNPGGDKLHNAGLVHLSVQGRALALRWVNRSGQVRTQRLPAPVDPFQPGALVAPPGEWADVVLVLDGPVRLDGQTESGQRFSTTLDLGEWTIPLEDPSVSTGGRVLDLDLVVPAGPRGSGDAADAALLTAVRDGALAR